MNVNMNAYKIVFFNTDLAFRAVTYERRSTFTLSIPNEFGDIVDGKFTRHVRGCRVCNVCSGEHNMQVTILTGLQNVGVILVYGG